MHVELVRGDLARRCATALCTSANTGLIGNSNPNYWKFCGRKNVDGSVRQAGGTQLRDACLLVQPQSWPSPAPQSEAIRCITGDAVVTRAFGALDADYVIHAVAPDSNFAYDNCVARSGNPDDGSAAIRLLESTYRAVFRRAGDLGAASLALPSLGTGVNGWKPTKSSRIALSTLCAFQADANLDYRVEHVAFVLRDDAAWLAWQQVFCSLLGQPENGTGDLRWSVETRLAASLSTLTEARMGLL